MGLHFDSGKQAFRIQLANGKALGRKRISRLLPRATTREHAQAIHDKMKAELYASAYLPNKERGWEEHVACAVEEPSSWFHAMLQRSRRHAKARGREHVLSEGQLQFICLRSAGRCEVTGIRFSSEKLAGRSIRPFQPSLDRIESSKGYNADNCRLVLTAVNLAMSAWGEEVLREVALGYVINRFCAQGLVNYLKKIDI
jgi:hypothetical protein